MLLLICHLICSHNLENFEVLCLYAMIGVHVLLQRGLQEQDAPDQRFLQPRDKCRQSRHFILPSSCAVVNAEDFGVQEACFSFELPFGKWQEVDGTLQAPMPINVTEKVAGGTKDPSKEGIILLSTSLLQ